MKYLLNSSLIYRAIRIYLIFFADYFCFRRRYDEPDEHFSRYSSCLIGHKDCKQVISGFYYFVVIEDPT